MHGQQNVEICKIVCRIKIAIGYNRIYKCIPVTFTLVRQDSNFGGQYIKDDRSLRVSSNL